MYQDRANKGLQFSSCLDIIYQMVPYRSFPHVYRMQNVLSRNNPFTGAQRGTKASYTWTYSKPEIEIRD